MRKSFEFLESPYESKCSNYDSSKTPFNSLSHKHCIRQCIRYYSEQQLNCSCFWLDNGFYEMDFGFKNFEMCTNVEFINKYNSLSK